MEQLREKIRQIDGRGYKAYKGLEGRYRYPAFELHIDHAQGDPFADPSRCRIVIERFIPPGTDALALNPARRHALEDFLARAFAAAIHRHVRGRRGSGRSGEFAIAHHGQQILRRNAVLIEGERLELRFQLALPANGRTVNAGQAGAMLFDELPRVVADGLLALADRLDAARRHLDATEDQQALRARLAAEGLVAFVADGSNLPRRSGIDDRPLPEGVPTRAPDSLAVTLDTPHSGPLRGLGVREGITLIVGGGFHGKSTLLAALELGVYDHIPGDGRERVVTRPDAVKVRAEDGRAVTGVDISPFINNLPQGKDTRRFTTANASGSTSQAANIVEALACDGRLLLIDEDTSATNFMIRDARMQALVAKEKEPITPLLQRIDTLYRSAGVSVVMVMGGSGDFFAVADRVVMLDNYRLRDVSTEARELAGTVAMEETPDATFGAGAARLLPPASLPATCRNDREKIQPFATRALRYGCAEIDLGRVEQLVDTGQLLAIGYLIRHANHRYLDGRRDLVDALAGALADAERDGLDSITPYIMGTLALPRLHELVATVNRLRGLTLQPADTPEGRDKQEVTTPP